MTAKILPFRRGTHAPREMTSGEQSDLVDMLVDLAIHVERGDVAEFWAAIVMTSGETCHSYIVPKRPRKMIIAMDRAKHELIRVLEEDGSR